MPSSARVPGAVPSSPAGVPSSAHVPGPVPGASAAEPSTQGFPGFPRQSTAAFNTIFIVALCAGSELAFINIYGATHDAKIVTSFRA